MKIPRIILTYKELKYETEKAYLFIDKKEKEFWLPKSICHIADIDIHGIRVAVAPFKFSELTGIVPQHLNTDFIKDDNSLIKEFSVEEVYLHKSKLEFMQHQLEAFNRANKLRYYCYYMDIGTGKTLPAISLAISRLKAGLINQILVLCPVSLKYNWAFKFKEYYPNEKLPLIYGIESFSLDSSFEKMKNALDFEIKEPSKTMIIADEFHKCKTHNAKRSKNINKYFSNYGYKLILTGTPISKNASDLYMQFSFLDKDILGFRNYYSFENYHLLYGGYRGKKVVAYANIEEFGKKISPFIYRVDKSVLKLPNKNYKKINFKLKKEQYILYKKVIDKICKLREKVKNSFSKRIDNNILGLTIRLQQLTSGFMPDIDFEFDKHNFSEQVKDAFDTSEYLQRNKNPRLKILSEIIEKNKQYVIFYKFNKEAEAIFKLCPKAKIINGNIPKKEKQKHEQDFQNKKINILVVNESMGIGIDLYSADTAIFYSTSFNLINRLQSEDRLHRKGQCKQVTIIDLIADKTIDERIQKVLFLKQDIADAFEKEIKKAKELKNENK